MESRLDAILREFANASDDIRRMNETLDKAEEEKRRWTLLLSEARERSLGIPLLEAASNGARANLVSLEKDVAEARRKLDEAERSLEDAVEELHGLERDLAATRDELQFVASNRSELTSALRNDSLTLAELEEEANRVFSALLDTEVLSANRTMQLHHLRLRLGLIEREAERTESSIRTLELSVERALRRYNDSSDLESRLRTNLARLRAGDASAKAEIEALSPCKTTAAG